MSKNDDDYEPWEISPADWEAVANERAERIDRIREQIVDLAAWLEAHQGDAISMPLVRTAYRICDGDKRSFSSILASEAGAQAPLYNRD